MDRFDEDGYQQLLRNQENADRDLEERRKLLKEYDKAKNKRGKRPKLPPAEPLKIIDKDGRELSVCPACGGCYDDTKGGAPEPRNKRQFTNSEVDYFVCFCDPFRVHERYKK